MAYADVAVDAPTAPGRTFSYAIPSHLPLAPGCLVRVPFGPRTLQGIVMALAQSPGVSQVRPVTEVIGPGPLLSATALELARWLSATYLAPLFQCAALMLPPGFRTRPRSYLEPVAPFAEQAPDAAQDPQALRALRLLAARRMDEDDARRALGPAGVRTVARLLRQGRLRRVWEWPRPRTAAHYEHSLVPVLAAADSGPALEQMRRRAPRQAQLLEAVRAAPGGLAVSRARKLFGDAAVRGLLARGLVGRLWERVERRPALEGAPEVPVARLSAAQERALAAVTAALDAAASRRPGAGPAPSFLLHGVTGSGKTEVYVRALEHCLRLGKRGILLVPEISLTPQTVHRLSARLPGRVAVLHSGLRPGELFDQWWRIADGDADIVVGPRSALFAPVAPLGLIVLDEEHEWTYKQADAAPRYHARETALRLAELSGAVVLMGSATPDVVTYYHAGRGVHTLLELPRRVAPEAYGPASPTSPPIGAGESAASAPGEGSLPMAQVHVVDMAAELKAGNRSIFSRRLAASLETTLERGEKAILLINRRGDASVVQCRDCGYVATCRCCSTPLTYHAAIARLVCHHCNARSTPPATCPRCRSPRIRYLGLGTQRVVLEVERRFPGVPVLRWDQDAARATRAPDSLLTRFAGAQVLVGTQMVAKGLHVPEVTLVGVVLADIGLALPDFRAGERAFQLLTQVAGRAGRGHLPGQVVVQTYRPDHYAIRAAAAQDYAAFCRAELSHRRQQGDPPFSRLAHLVFLHTNAALCQREAERVGRMLRHHIAAQGLVDTRLVGPAPGTPERLRGHYRWHILLRARDPAAVLQDLSLGQGWTVDIDPVAVL